MEWMKMFGSISSSYSLQRNRKIKGQALGSIVYGTVMSHPGFDVDTQPGQGSTFHIYLPAHYSRFNTPPDSASAGEMTTWRSRPSGDTALSIVPVTRFRLTRARAASKYEVGRDTELEIIAVK